MTDGSLRVQVDDRHTAELARCLVEAGVAVTELRREERQLEEVFMEMTEHGDEMPSPAGETANARETEVHHV
jgi:ABC-2 type transport system ATP-binding protein